MTRMGNQAACFALAGMMALLLCGCGKTGGAEEAKPELNTSDEQQANQPPLPEKLTVVGSRKVWSAIESPERIGC